SSAAARAPPSGTTSSPSSIWTTGLAASAASRASCCVSAAASETPVKPASISRCKRSASGAALPARGGSLKTASGPRNGRAPAAGPDELHGVDGTHLDSSRRRGPVLKRSRKAAPAARQRLMNDLLVPVVLALELDGGVLDGEPVAQHRLRVGEDLVVAAAVRP